MASNASRICITILKEFWLPFLLAVGIGFCGVSADQLRSVQGYFFGFLMLAWFTGQIVRITREIERKDSVAATLDRLSNLSAKLDKQLEMISGHATGGKSFIRVHPYFHEEAGFISIASSVEGEYPVRNVDLTVQDLDVELPYTTMKHDYTEIMWPGEMREHYRWPAGEKDQHRILVNFVALNHSTYCEVIVRRWHDGTFARAHRQRINSRPWVYEISPDFPEYDAARPELLFKFDMPDGAWRADN
ncbi:hypothetical protein [Pandoraea sputorum]|uniref:hypothetical protein n=1 Tax=Pandoraea sputorum TaxID=93222 RepID=UPI002F409835